jgi:hypothetical protein
MAPPAGLEPARVTGPADFESALYTISARRQQHRHEPASILLGLALLGKDRQIFSATP